MQLRGGVDQVILDKLLLSFHIQSKSRTEIQTNETGETQSSLFQGGHNMDVEKELLEDPLDLNQSERTKVTRVEKRITANHDEIDEMKEARKRSKFSDLTSNKIFEKFGLKKHGIKDENQTFRQKLIRKIKRIQKHKRDMRIFRTKHGIITGSLLLTFQDLATRNVSIRWPSDPAIEATIQSIRSAPAFLKAFLASTAAVEGLRAGGARRSEVRRPESAF